MPRLLGEKDFHIPNLLKKLPDYSSELKTLKRRGFIKEDNDLQSGYCVTAEVMLSFVADELITALREDENLDKMLHRETQDGVFTKGEKEQLTVATKSLWGFVKEGADIISKVAGVLP